MKVMLVDDHPLFMEGLQYVLKTYGIEVAGTAKNGKEAVEKARLEKPDVILMDINMPEFNGLDALRIIKVEMPETEVVMLTISEADEDLFDAVKYGASGYLLKNTDSKALIDMLKDLQDGEVTFSQGLAAKILKEFKNVPQKTDCSGVQNTQKLTERQVEVLEMVARGITYKEAGERLGLTERTVKYHMARILELLHLENRAQVIAYAAKMGIVNGEE